MTFPRHVRCPRCGMESRWHADGPPPVECVECEPVAHTGPCARLATVVAGYRLAIEEATGALMLGRPRQDALEALLRVQSPARTLRYSHRGREPATTRKDPM